MESPFACDMSAIPSAERGDHLAAIEEVFGAVREIREIPDGGVKPFILAEIGQALNPEAAQAAGFKL